MRESSRDRVGLRPGRVEDHADFVRLFAELGVVEPAPPLDAWVTELVGRSFFVDGPDGAAAYALIDVLGHTGYVVNVVVAPEHRGRGLGGGVMRALADHLRARGCRDWMLYVKPDNVPALALYTGLGMVPGVLETSWRVTRQHLEALPRTPEELEVVPVEEGDFALLTARFGLVAGKLARFAAQRGLHELWRLVDPRLPQGVGGWMDLRRQAAVLVPFFAATPAHARGLLEAAFAELRSVSELGVVTGDEALSALLEAAGARPVMRTLRMKGALPDMKTPG